MRQNLLETYRAQLNVAEAYVNKNFNKEVSSNTKLTTAVLLDNTNRWITESMNTVATNRGDLGDWKKFCLNLTNIAVPSLIANDLVIVHPMTSYSGSVAYLKYVSKTDKGDIKKGFEFNSVFGMGKMNDARVDFTAPATVETAGEGGALALTPVANGKLVSKTKDTDGTFKKADIKIGEKFCTITVSGGANVYTDVADGTTVTIAKDDKVVYFAEEFQMDHVPATDIPTIGPVMEHIALVAEPRRIAVKYDQITA